MTERIQALRQLMLEGRHHAFRREAAVDCARYRRVELPAHRRMALRLQAFLEAEQPVILEGERIAFTRTLPALPGIYGEAEWEALSDQHFIHERGNVCNLCPDYASTIARGLNARLQEIRAARDAHPARAEYLDSMELSVRAVLRLTARYADCARAQGRADLAAMLCEVPARGARTLLEALQSFRILHFALWCEGEYHNTLGRFDQYMLPYLKSDLEAGRLTPDGALELIEEFFLTLNRDSDLYPGMQQGDNGQSLVLGGVTPAGEDGFNQLSQLCLRACGELRLIDPKINLRVSNDTPLSVYEQGTELTRLGLGFPQYENDDVVIPGLIRLGYRPEDARDYVVAACWEFIVPGVGMDIPNIAALSFPAAVKAAALRALPAGGGMEELLKAAREEIDRQVDQIERSVRGLYVMPAPFASLLFRGCVRGARDISEGNRYNNYGVHGTGLATAVDSLAAIEQAVFREGMNPDRLLQALAADFRGEEALQHHLKYDCPKMGNDDQRADRFAELLLQAFARAVEGRVNERGGLFRAGTGTAMYYLWHAESLGATPDGRGAADPLPANYAPSLYARLDGPASLLRSFAKPDLSLAINGGPLTIEFHDAVFRGPESIGKVAMLIRSFFLMGGHQLQLNTVNRERLLEAQRDPASHRNLIVRVWGWSGYFVELDRCYQDHIIRRMELRA